MSTSPLRVTGHIIAYIDLLGATQELQRNENSFLNTCHSVFQEQLEKHGNFCANKSMFTDSPMGHIVKNISMKIFSDNIVIFCKLPDSYIDENLFLIICSVLHFSSNIQYGFLKQDILTRGAITIGDFCETGFEGVSESNSMILGKALVRASELEKHIAIYPRVIIDGYMLEQCSELASAIQEGANVNWVKRDSDGIYYLDYLYALKDHAEILTSTIENSITYINGEISEYESLAGEKSLSRMKVYQKHVWHRNYIESWKKYLEEDVPHV